MSLLPEERVQAIMAVLRRDGRLLVDAMAEEFGVSGETIRRDLKRLEKAGLLRRSHGGAVPLPPRQGEDLPFPARSVLNAGAKRKIAAAAARHVQDSQSLMLDSSSTVHEVMPHLGARQGLTLITNSVALLSDPFSMPHKLLSVGGEWQRDLMTFRGPLAVDAIRRFHADLAFISVKALSPRSGLLVANAEEAELKRAFVESARKTILLADGDKFDGAGLVAFAELGAISHLITDRQPSEEWSGLLDKAGVVVEIAV